MNAIRQLLAATDFSGAARHAAMRAAMLASQHQAELRLVHVLNEPSLATVRFLLKGAADIEAGLLADVRQSLRDEAAALASAHASRVEARVLVGKVVEEILAECSRADLAVVGGHGDKPVRDVLLGSTAERLVGRSASPVLVVRRAPEEAYRRILLAVDIAGASPAEDLRLAMRIAPQAEITVLHAYALPFEGRLTLAGVIPSELDRYRAEAAARAREQVEALIRAEAGDRAGIRPLVARGDAPFVILSQQAELRADLIVLGSRRRSAAELFLLGSVSRRVLAEAACDVLVRPDRTAG